MEMTSGLWDRMVVQRQGGGACDVPVVGTCKANGTLRVTVRAGGTVLRGWRDVGIGQARRGTFRGRVRGLKTGGPYEIDLRIEGAAGKGETLRIRDVLVGDVWVLAGQSNMQGAGERERAAAPQRLVRAFTMDDRWDVARDPIHNLWAAVDAVHGAVPGDVDGGVGGVGPGVAFAQELHRRTGVPQGVIACAHGGTSMAQWSPALKEQGGQSFYGTMLRRVRRNGGRVAGVFWYQGESDVDPPQAPLYTERMQELVRAMRRDFQDRALPIVAVQLCWFGGSEPKPGWNSIQDQQRRLPERIRKLAVVPSIDLGLVDHIHLDARGQAILGRRAADAMAFLCGGPKAGAAPMALKSIRLVPYDAKLHVNIVVEFENVVGGLQSAVRPFGFTVCENGKPVHGFYGTVLDGNRVILRTTLFPAFLLDRQLYYGFGTNPACNITDGAGRSLPVFGPVRMGGRGLFTPFVRTFRVSQTFPGAGDLATLEYPRDRDALGLKPAVFVYEFAQVFERFQQGQDEVIYFACRVACGEPMKLALLLGYDGPVKAWVDGKVVCHDPTGRCPAPPDAKRVVFQASRGEHEVLVALGSNHAQAWGIYMRFARLGVRRGQDGALPEILG